MGKEISVEPDLLDGGLTDSHLEHSRDARRVAEHNAATDDDALDEQTAAEEAHKDPAEKKRYSRAVLQISDRGGQERRVSIGLSKQEEGGALVDGKRYKEGLVWKNGYLQDRPNS